MGYNNHTDRHCTEVGTQSPEHPKLSDNVSGPSALEDYLDNALIGTSTSELRLNRVDQGLAAL